MADTLILMGTEAIGNTSARIRIDTFGLVHGLAPLQLLLIRQRLQRIDGQDPGVRPALQKFHAGET